MSTPELVGNNGLEAIKEEEMASKEEESRVISEHRMIKKKPNLN